jgi:hypothetical protein
MKQLRFGSILFRVAGLKVRHLVINDEYCTLLSDQAPARPLQDVDLTGSNGIRLQWRSRGPRHRTAADRRGRAQKWRDAPKGVLRRLLPRRVIETTQQTIGTMNYLRSPDRGLGWGPFNGQSARQALFVDIIMKMRPVAIVETGTFLGATTELMHQTGLPVFTIESHPRNYGFARARFWRSRNVTLLYQDSRAGLHKLFDGPLHPLSGLAIFFYLDAHWNEDLPLADEIDIVFSRCARALVMIDDFEVPSDAGYGFDDYGPGKALILDYIQSVISAHQLRVFYPSTRSVADYPSTPMAAEGLAALGRLRRGCVVLAKGACHGPVIDSISLLRPATEGELTSTR